MQNVILQTAVMPYLFSSKVAFANIFIGKIEKA